MKKMSQILLILLAAVLLLSACGETDKTDPKDRADEEDTGPSINYEDYITPVVDREVTDCITAEELSAVMGVSVQLVYSTDSVATYQSEDAYYMVTLALENKTRAEFDAMVAESDSWTFQENVGEVAYWGVDQTELIAYQDGYAVSVAGYHIYYGCLQSIMEHMLRNLQ